MAPAAPLVIVCGFSENSPEAYWATDQLSPGLQTFTLQSELGGMLRPTGFLPAEAARPNPSYMAAHPSGRAVYSVCGDERQPVGEVVAHSCDSSSGSLSFLNRVASGGSGPCHCTVDSAGRFLLVANIGSSTVVVFKIRQCDLGLQPVPVEQKQLRDALGRARDSPSNAHSVVLSATNEHAFVSDLAAAMVAVYQFDRSEGTLQAVHAVSTGSTAARARHLVCNPSNDSIVYGLNQGTRGVDAGSVSTYHFDAHVGRLCLIDRASTLPPADSKAGQPDWVGASAICIAPSGRFLYCSNRGKNGVPSNGSDSVAVFRVDASTGTLSWVAHTPTLGACPRDIAMDPSGQFLLVGNQDTHTVATFAVDQELGVLQSTGQLLKTAAPNCLLVIDRATKRTRRQTSNVTALRLRARM